MAEVVLMFGDVDPHPEPKSSLPPGLEEVPHKGMFKLLRTGQQFSVQHVLTAEKVDLPDDGSWASHIHGDRAFVASRKAMVGATTHALTIDATRFAGRNWNCGIICNVETQTFAWLQPVAAV